MVVLYEECDWPSGGPKLMPILLVNMDLAAMKSNAMRGLELHVDLVEEEKIATS